MITVPPDSDFEGSDDGSSIPDLEAITDSESGEEKESLTSDTATSSCASCNFVAVGRGAGAEATLAVAAGETLDGAARRFCAERGLPERNEARLRGHLRREAAARERALELVRAMPPYITDVDSWMKFALT